MSMRASLGVVKEPERAVLVHAARALTTRYLDFWLLGGASVVMWALVSVLDPLRAHSWAVAHHYTNLPALSATLALVVNYPHFMASYALAYRQGWRYALPYSWQLVAVPLGLAVCMIVGYRLYGDPETGRWPMKALGAATQILGLHTTIGQSATAGKEIMGLLVNLMFFTVGWHYSKQAYGCMMVYAAYDGYKLTPVQRRLLKGSLYTIWAASYTNANLNGTVRDYYGVPYLGLGLPTWTYHASMLVFIVGLSAFAYVIVLKNYEQNGQRPSANFLVPYASFAVWWLPPLVHQDFFILAVPFFHSLQYLPFVYKVERVRLEAHHPTTVGLRGTFLVLGLILAGFLSFELLPNTADAYIGTFPLMNAWFFFVCAQLFINIHHYFIDNVIWRFSNPQVREYLLA
jgi:hypothetical protein